MALFFCSNEFYIRYNNLKISALKIKNSGGAKIIIFRPKTIVFFILKFYFCDCKMLPRMAHKEVL